MKRWVGLGVIADNVINIGHAMEKQSTLTTNALQK
jgi:transposase, IS5 family